MDTDRKIRIGIFANPRRSDGASTKTDGLPFKMDYEVPSCASVNMFSYSFSRTERYTLFMMYCGSGSFWTMDGFPGTLNIGVSISRGYVLSEGKSVYDLLMAVIGKLKKDYMSESKDVNGRDKFSFIRPMELLTQSYFDDILKDYPVSESRSSYNPMTGTQPVGIELDNDRIRFLFRDVDYYINRHFKGYSEVIVAPKLNGYFVGQTMPLPTKTIKLVPADDSYKIIAYYDNDGAYYGNDRRQLLSEPGGSPEVVVNEQDFARKIIVTSNRDEMCYERGKVSFTVNQVLAFAQKGSGLQIDGVTYNPGSEKIVCVPHDKPKSETFRIDLRTPETPADLMYGLKLKLGDQEISINHQDGQFTLEGEQIARKEYIESSYYHSKYEMKGRPFWSYDGNNSFSVSLKHKESGSAQQTSASGPAKTSGGISQETKPGRTEGKSELKFKIPKDAFSDEVTLSVRRDGLRVSRTIAISDSSESKDSKLKDYVSLPLQSDFLEGNGNDVVSVAVYDKSRIWKKEYNVGRIKSIQANNISIQIDSSQIENKKGGRMLGKIFFWSAPILFILWLATGVFAFSQWRENSGLKEENEDLKTQIENLSRAGAEASAKNVSDPQSQVVSDESKAVDTPPKPTAPELTRDQKSTFTRAAEELSKKDLTFAKVNDLYALYSGLCPILRTQADTEYPDAVAKIKAYHAVVDILQNGEAEAIKTLNTDNADMQLLNKYHRDLVLAIYYGDYRGEEPKLYAEESIELRNKPTKLGSKGGLNLYILKWKKGEYEKFEDLEHMFDINTRNYSQNNDR